MLQGVTKPIRASKQDRERLASLVGPQEASFVDFIVAHNGVTLDSKDGGLNLSEGEPIALHAIHPLSSILRWYTDSTTDGTSAHYLCFGQGLDPQQQFVYCFRGKHAGTVWLSTAPDGLAAQRQDKHTRCLASRFDAFLSLLSREEPATGQLSQSPQLQAVSPPLSKDRASGSNRDSIEKAFGAGATTPEGTPVTGDSVLASLARDMLREQQVRRRWSVFFRIVTLALVIGTVGLIMQLGKPSGLQTITQNEDPFVAVVRVEGVIDNQSESNADRVITNLRQAVQQTNSKGVILDINSPGGSPVQSASIYREIRHLRNENPQIPIYAVVSDVGASGAYYIAAAAEYIYADPTSLVGSIGVLYGGFGFVDAMQKIGVERRLITSGDQKASLDPFLPRNEEAEEHLRQMLEEVHQQFVDDVIASRSQLANAEPIVFSGAIFGGTQALELGLIDGFGDRFSVARDVFGTENLVLIDVYQDQWLNVLEQLSDVVTGTMMHAVRSAFTISTLH